MVGPILILAYRLHNCRSNKREVAVSYAPCRPRRRESTRPCPTTDKRCRRISRAWYCCSCTYSGIPLGTYARVQEYVYTEVTAGVDASTARNPGQRVSFQKSSTTANRPHTLFRLRARLAGRSKTFPPRRLLIVGSPVVWKRGSAFTYENSTKIREARYA